MQVHKSLPCDEDRDVLDEQVVLFAASGMWINSALKKLYSWKHKNDNAMVYYNEDSLCHKTVAMG